MAGQAVLRSNDFKGNSKKIHINDLVHSGNEGKRPALQTITGGRQSFLLLVSVSNRSGFSSETKVITVLGKNPDSDRISMDTALGPRERLLERPAGPGPGKPIFCKFELLSAKEAKAALQMLNEQG